MEGVQQLKKEKQYFTTRAEPGDLLETAIIKCAPPWKSSERFPSPHSSSEVQLFASAPQAGWAEMDFPFKSYRRGKDNPNQLERGCAGREGSWEG